MRRITVLFLALVGATCSQPVPDDRCVARVEVTLGGKAVYALVRALDSRGHPIPLEGLLSRGLGLEEGHVARSWFVLPGQASVRLPRERVTIEAFRGLDTELGRLEVDLSGRPSADLRVDLEWLMGLPVGLWRWRSANTHLHLKQVSREEADRYLGEVPRADGLDALFVSYLERADADREYVSNRLTEADLRELTERTGVLFGNGEEHRHNFAKPGEAPGKSFSGEGYGHVMFLNLQKLIRPVSIGPGIMKAGTDGIPLRRGIDEARGQGATVLWCHNTYGLEDIPNWVAGRPHAQNIFDGDPATHGSYKDTFYRYLNAGLRVPFSTGTDWFIYDFSRVYARVDSMKSTRDWLASLEKGRTFITNGPLLDFTVNGQEPGATLRLDGPGPVHVQARAIGRVDFRFIELIRNGALVKAAHSSPKGRHFESDLSMDVDVTGPCWLALRIPPEPVKDEPAPVSELGGPLFAHTSPVYVEVAGKHVFDVETARGLLEEVRASRETILKSAVFADDHERGHVLEVYAAAAAVLEKMLR